jgi:two-component system, NarL family, sensor kinase
MEEKDIALAVVCTTLLILLLIAVILIVFIVSGKQRVKQQMLLSETKLNYERELRKAETEVSEEMMAKFAQELHDNVGQLLTAMHIQIENQKIDYPDLAAGFQPIEKYLSEVTQQLRILSRTLNNDYIGHIGLLSAIQLETERLKSLRKFQVHWQTTVGESNLNKNQELMLFRIFQEIIQNGLRHSFAKNLYITVNNSNEKFELNVKDDGKGFDVEKTLQTNKASGLRNIMKRAKLAGFNCKMESSSGNGFSIDLKKIANVETP